jgi:hypothetical protein
MTTSGSPAVAGVAIIGTGFGGLAAADQNWPASTVTFRRRLRRLRPADFLAAPVPAPSRPTASS